jgi:hypothetical protein
VLPRLPAGEDDDTTAPIVGFSARILAQDLGQGFVEHLSHILQTGHEVSEVNLTEEVFTPIARAWEARLHRYIACCEARGIPLLEELPKLSRNDRAMRRLDWLSTFTGGVFFPRERRILLMNYGASGGIVFSKSPAVIEPNSSYVGVVAIIRPDEPLPIKIGIAADKKVGWTEFVDVDGFALVSDGLKADGDLSERLQELQGKACHSFKDLRHALLTETYPTEDDKAVVIGHFI